MFSLVFVICLTKSNLCFTTSPENIFKSVEECTQFATKQELLWTNNNEMPPHLAIHQCVSWGTPTKALFTEG